MASIVKASFKPSYNPSLESSVEENAFIRRYLANATLYVREGRYDPDEVPERAFLESGHKALPDFVAIHHRLGLLPETQTLVEEFKPGVHQFLPVEIVRRRGRRPVHRPDGRVLDAPYHLFIPQTFLDAVWIERSALQVTTTDLGPPMVVPHLGSDSIVLRHAAVAGHHAWRGLFHLPRRVFFPDALTRAVEARRLRKLECARLGEA